MTNKVKVSYNEKFNWLMHHHFVTKDFHQCKLLADQIDSLSKTNSEYAGRMKGMVGRVDGQVQASLKHFQAASAINPENIDNLKQVAKSFTLLSMYKQALTTYDQAEAVAPNDWEVAHHKALCYLSMKDYHNAKIYASKALESKKNRKTLILLGKIWRMEGDGEGVFEAYVDALRLCPDHPDLLCQLALLCMQRGDKSNAFSHASKCVALSRNHLGGMLVLGNILQTEGSGDVALSKYKVLSPHHPDSASLWNNLSMCFFGRRKLIATVSCLKRALYFRPFEAAVLYNCALVHASMQLFASAFQYVSLSLALKLKSPEILMLLAVIMTNLQDIDSAEQAYKKALELNSTDPLTLVNYALICFKRGELPQAREALKSCRHHLRDDNPCATEIKELLSKLGKVLLESN